MLRIKVIRRLSEAQGDSEPLVGINMDFLKKKNPKKPEDNPKEYYMKLQSMAKKGIDDMFSKRIIDFFESPELKPEYLPQTGKKYFIKWLANSIKDGNTPEKLEDIRYVKDYFEGTNATELPPNFFDAYKKSEEWHEELAKTAGQVKGGYKTNEVVYEAPNGYKIVRMAWDTGPREDVKHDLLLEGDKMGNCVGKLHCRKILKSGESIFSLRDKDNEPHVTMNIFHDEKSPDADKLDDPNDEGDWNDNDDDGLFELEESLLNENAYIPDSSERFDEIKGKQNRLPEEKYLDIIAPWIIKTFKPGQYIKAEGGIITKSKYFDISLLEPYLEEKITKHNSSLLQSIASNPKISPEKIIRLIDGGTEQLKNRKKGDEDPYYAQSVVKTAFGNPNLPLEYLISKLDSNEGVPGLAGHIVANPSFTFEAADKLLKDRDYTVKSTNDREIISQITISFRDKLSSDDLVRIYEKNKKPTKIAMKAFLSNILLDSKFPNKLRIEAFMTGLVVNNMLIGAILEGNDEIPTEFYSKLLQYFFSTGSRDLYQSLIDVVRSKKTPLEFIKTLIDEFNIEDPANETLFTEILDKEGLPEELFIKVADPIIDTFKDSQYFQDAKNMLCDNPNLPEQLLKKIIMNVDKRDLHYFNKLINNPSVTAEMLQARKVKTKDKRLMDVLNKGIELKQNSKFKKQSEEELAQINESKIFRRLLLLAGIKN